MIGSEAQTASKTLGVSYGKTEKVTKIKGFDTIDVDIIPGSAFSDMQARQDVVELRKLGVKIPDSFILDTYKIGNTADLIEKFNEEQEEGEKQSPDQMIADGENQKMMNG